MGLSSWSWPFPFLVRLGWLTVRCPNPPADRVRGRAFLLRGNGAVFSRGLGALCGRLRRAGWWAEDLRCVGDRWACRRLRADQTNGRHGGPVVFVGHSCGGRHALFAAQRLAEAGIGIDLIVCLDAAWAPPVAANVRRAVHLFRTQRRIYPARPLVPAADSTSCVENIDLDAPGSPLDPRGLHHLNITGRPDVQEWVFRQVLQAGAPGAGSMV